ncbi:cation transporter [candidate division TA06 bacterium]|nr:cation transporter [candidate division TA06 bacterium]
MEEQEAEAEISPQAGELQTVTFKVDGMYCGACVSKVQKAVLAVNGVTDCKVDYGKKVAICTFDKSKTTSEKLTLATKGTPYTLTVAN